METTSLDEELKLFESKLNHLKLDYEKYFLGTRPTEPAQTRADVQKTVIRWSNMRITNTAHRFKFNSLNGRYQAFKRQWDNILRQIDAGTYKRHVFKADLRDRERGIGVPAANATGTEGSSGPKVGGSESLFETYRDAVMATGQNASGLTPEKLQRAIAKHEAAIKQKFGCDKVEFKVVVTDGKVKLKAAAA
jgi:hypothetical protein